MPGVFRLLMIVLFSFWFSCICCRKHAKVSAKPLARAGVLEDANVEAAKREWADLVLSDADQ